MKKTALSRRAVLRGALGTAIGLPLLECMLDRNGEAHADGSGLPSRYFLSHAPTSLVTSGSREDGMTPVNAGFGYDIRPVLQPLADLGIAADVSVVSGLFAPPIDAPGGYNSDYHGHAPYAVMTGRRSGWNGTLYLPQTWSADQIVVQRFGALTRFPYLYFQLDSQSGGTYLCYEEDGNPDADFRQIEPQMSPASAYRQLFMDFTPPSDEPDPDAELERRLRLSSISYAKDRLTALQGRLGAADKRTLDEHLTRVRDLENRILSTTPGTIAPSCRDPELGNDDPPDVSTDLPDQAARASLFVDLAEMAFACDMTRVITIGGASRMTGSGMRNPTWNAIGGLHGEVQHTADQSDLDAANRWFVDVYARCVARFKATAEGAGTVLDSTAALFVMEGGKGLTNDDQRSGDGGGDPNHSVDNAVMMLAGRAGGLKAGQHVDLTGRDLHPAAVINAAYRALGIDATLGEITDVVEELFIG